MKLKLNAHSIAVIFGLVIILVHYQNCGEVGGSLSWSPYTSMGIDCIENPQSKECDATGIGDPKKLAIGFSKSVGSRDETSLGVVFRSDATMIPITTGTCNNGGFEKTRIRWRLRLLNSNAQEKTDAENLGPNNKAAYIKCNGTTFSFEVYISKLFPPGTLKDNDTMELKTSIEAYDSKGNIYRHPTLSARSATYRISFAPVIDFPVIDSRAAEIDSGESDGINYWKELQVFKGYDSGQTTIKNLGGYCEYRGSNFDNTVTAFMVEVGHNFIPTNADIQINAAQCKPLPSGVSAPAENGHPRHNGYFKFQTEDKPVGSTGGGWFKPLAGWPAEQQSNARHAEIYVTQANVIQGVAPAVSPKVPLHFKFFSHPSSRGWTFPTALKTIERYKKMIYLKKKKASSEIDDELQASAREIMEFLEKPANLPSTSGEWGLRLKLFNLARATEWANQGARAEVQTGYEDTASLANKIWRMANNKRGCDLGVTSIFDVPYENLKGIEPIQFTGNTSETQLRNHTVGDEPEHKRDLNMSQDRLAQKMALCLETWVNRTLMDDYSTPNNEVKLVKMLEKGLTINLVNGVYEYCEATGDTSSRITDGGFCWRVHSAYRDFAVLIKKINSKATGTNTSRTYVDLSGNSPIVSDFYNGVVQHYVNRGMMIICHDGNGFKYEVLSSLGLPLNDKTLFTEKSRFTGAKDFVAYNWTKECGSQDANHSLIDPYKEVPATIVPSPGPSGSPTGGTQN